VRGTTSSLAGFLYASLPGGKESGSPLKGKAYSIERLDLRSAAADGKGRVILDALLSGFILSNQAY